MSATRSNGSNTDFVAHTATARDGAWDVVIPVNATKGVVLKAEGTVDKFHPNMTGRVFRRQIIGRVSQRPVLKFRARNSPPWRSPSGSMP
jgi:hypothetical protein